MLSEKKLKTLIFLFVCFLFQDSGLDPEVKGNCKYSTPLNIQPNLQITLQIEESF